MPRLCRNHRRTDYPVSFIANVKTRMRHSVVRVRKQIMSSKWHSAAVELSELFAPFVLDITGWFNRSLRGGNLSRSIRVLLQGSRIQGEPSTTLISIRSFLDVIQLLKMCNRN